MDAVRWNGTSWSIQAMATPSDAQRSWFDGVTFPSSSSCVAAGVSTDGSSHHRALAERWNGSTWAIEATPDPAGDNHLRAVSCAPGGTP